MKDFKQTVIAAFCIVIPFLLFCSKDSTEPSPGDNNAVTLEEIDDVLPNPYKGFVPWIGSQNPVYETKLQYKTFEWHDIEPQKGVFNRSVFERNLHDAA